MRVQLVGLAALLVTFAAAQGDRITVTIAGELVRFKGTQPLMLGNRVLVPLRGVFEKMGASVQWKAASRGVTVLTDDKRVELTVGSATARVNGEDRALDTEAILVEGRTMVPLRFIAEALGAGTVWRPGERRVIITPHGR